MKALSVTLPGRFMLWVMPNSESRALELAVGVADCGHPRLDAVRSHHPRHPVLARLHPLATQRPVHPRAAVGTGTNRPSRDGSGNPAYARSTAPRKSASADPAR